MPINSVQTAYQAQLLKEAEEKKHEELLRRLIREELNAVLDERFPEQAAPRRGRPPKTQTENQDS